MRPDSNFAINTARLVVECAALLCLLFLCYSAAKTNSDTMMVREMVRSFTVDKAEVESRLARIERRPFRNLDSGIDKRATESSDHVLLGQ